MSCTIKKAVKRTLFGVIAALVVASALIVIGCGKDPVGPPDNGGDEDTTKTDTSGKIGYDPALILGDGFAWIGGVEFQIPGTEVVSPYDLALIFKSDGVAEAYIGMLGVWNLEEVEPGNWYTIGNKLYAINMDEETLELDTVEMVYTVAGNTLTLVADELEEIGGSVTLTKSNWPPEVVDVDMDPELVNTMWVLIDEETGETTASWTFAYDEEESPLPMAVYYAEEGPNFNVYSWSTNDGNLILEPVMPPGSQITYAYSITGNILTIDGKEFTKELDLYNDEGNRAFSAASKLSKTKLPKKFW